MNILGGLHGFDMQAMPFPRMASARALLADVKQQGFSYVLGRTDKLPGCGQMP